MEPAAEIGPGPEGALRAARWIHFGLISGILTWVAIVAAGVLPEEPPAEAEHPIAPLLPLVAGGLTVAMVIPAMVLGGHLVRRSVQDRRLPAAERSRRYLSTKVLLAALIEGPGLFWGVLAFLSRNPLHLAGAAFSVVALAITFPREAELADLLDR